MKQLKIFVLAVFALVAACSLFMGNSVFSLHAYQSSSVTVWASSGTLSTGALYKMVEVAVDEPNMVAQGFDAGQIEGLRTEVINIFAAEKLRVELDYRAKVFAYTTDTLLRAELLSQSQFDVTQNDANTHTFLRFFRIVFGSRLAFQIYTNFAQAETDVQESYFTTKTLVINPVIIWGVCPDDNFVANLIDSVKTHFPQNTLPSNAQISVSLFYQWQTFLRREHSNANRIEMQMSGLYLHEWLDSENPEFIIYTVSANAALWYLVALGATALFLGVGLYLAKAVKEQKLKNRDLSSLVKEAAQIANQAELPKTDAALKAPPGLPKAPPGLPKANGAAKPNQEPPKDSDLKNNK